MNGLREDTRRLVDVVARVVDLSYNRRVLLVVRCRKLPCDHSELKGKISTRNEQASQQNRQRRNLMDDSCCSDKKCLHYVMISLTFCAVSLIACVLLGRSAGISAFCSRSTMTVSMRSLTPSPSSSITCRTKKN